MLWNSSSEFHDHQYNVFFHVRKCISRVCNGAYGKMRLLHM